MSLGTGNNGVKPCVLASHVSWQNQVCVWFRVFQWDESGPVSTAAEEEAGAREFLNTSASLAIYSKYRPRFGSIAQSFGSHLIHCQMAWVQLPRYKHTTVHYSNDSFDSRINNSQLNKRWVVTVGGNLQQISLPMFPQVLTGSGVNSRDSTSSCLSDYHCSVIYRDSVRG